MNRYILEDKIGEGTFGDVFRATSKKTASSPSSMMMTKKRKKKVRGNLHVKRDRNDNSSWSLIFLLNSIYFPCLLHKFAIKELKAKFQSWNDVSTQREVRAIKDLMVSYCPQIVSVYEISRESNGKLYFVMELMNDGTLYDYLGSVKKESSSRMTTNSHESPTVPETKIRSILFQTLLGIQFIHSRGYMHRDIKPENILLDGDTVKVGDYSLARKSSIRNVFRYRNNDDDKFTTTIMTNYVATRWYRAPELLHSNNTTYTNAIDMFAIGCVAAEIYRIDPLLQGTR